MDNSEKTLSRRKALGRIGLFATAAYTVPAFATLSMAHAASGASAASTASTASVASTTSVASVASVASIASVASGPSLSVPSGVEATCGYDGDLTDSTYVQCLVDGGVVLPEGFVLPEGVILPVL